MFIFKFEGLHGQLSKCEGKTITKIEKHENEYGCTWARGFLIEFSDGTRVYIHGQDSQGTIVGPQEKSLENSTIIKPEEFGALVAERKRKEQARREEAERQKRSQLAQLKRELGDE